MILYALANYYKRLLSNPDIEIPEPGYSVQKISFAANLSQSGDLLNFVDLREHEGKKAIPLSVIVPKPLGERSGKKAPPYFMWDKSKYLLGVELNKDKIIKTPDFFHSFCEFHIRLLNGVNDPGAFAVIQFLKKWKSEHILTYENYEDVISGGFIVFRLDGETTFIHEHPLIRQAWDKEYQAISSKVIGQCLVTGKHDVCLAKIHPQLKGVQGAQSSGAALVSFNADAFTSYDKEQSFNAPISEQAAFAYTTALNYLLRPDSGHKVQIGDATTVFWTERPSVVPSFITSLLGSGMLDNENKEMEFSEQLVEDKGRVKELRDFLQAVRSGRYPGRIKDADNPFYILGLSPNSARISVRFWHVSTVEEITKKLGKYFKELNIVKNDNEPEYPSMWALLRETAAQGKSENISPALAGQFMRSILNGDPYPHTLLISVLERIRAEQSRKDKKGKPIANVNYFKAALIKAYLLRNCKKEVTVSLDSNNTNEAYLLGRLFAVLEKAQEESVPGANATIKDRFYSAASATPGRVFPLLLRGAHHNIAKLRKNPEKTKRAIGFDIMIGEIMGNLKKFPRTLSLENQGMFCLGYYHQRKDLFAKKSEQTT